MIVHVATFLSSLEGSLDKDKYLRRLLGRPGWAVLCNKPKYSKTQQKQMGEREMVKKFTDINALAKAIYNDATLRAEWEQRHQEALQKTRRHPKKGKDSKPVIPVRLWDYIKKELNKEYTI